MYNIIELYINKLKKEDVANFAISKGVFLSSEELDFTYDFIKKNWQDIVKNPNLFEIDRYKNKYTPENFIKIKKVFQEYFQKFGNYL